MVGGLIEGGVGVWLGGGGGGWVGCVGGVGGLGGGERHEKKITTKKELRPIFRVMTASYPMLQWAALGWTSGGHRFYFPG